MLMKSDSNSTSKDFKTWFNVFDQNQTSTTKTSKMTPFRNHVILDPLVAQSLPNFPAALGMIAKRPRTRLESDTPLEHRGKWTSLDLEQTQFRGIQSFVEPHEAPP